MNEQNLSGMEPDISEDTAQVQPPAGDLVPAEEPAVTETFAEDDMTSGDASAEETTTEETSTEDATPEMDEEPFDPSDIYRQDYAQADLPDAAAKEKYSRRGVLTYAIVMTVCFAVSLGVLALSLIVGWGGPLFGGSQSSGSNGDGGYREIYIRDDVDSDTLTMQEISSAGNQVVVAITNQPSLGSSKYGTGIILTSDGYIATNSHVVNGAKTLIVQLYDGTEYTATLVGESEIDDLAVIKINAKGLPAAKIGKSSDALVGDRVVVIGHPAGLEFGWTSTYGRVSAINRDVQIREDDGTLTKTMTLLQTDATVNNGNSGGPMFNDRGEVIGIVTLKIAGDYEGLGFAIPIDTAMPLLNALIETGTVDGVESGVAAARPQLGVTFLSGTVMEEGCYYVITDSYVGKLTEGQAAETEGSFYAGATGLLVRDVLETADAFRYLQKDDIVTAMDGVAVTSFEQLREQLYKHKAGDTVRIEYYRDGQILSADILLSAAQ